MVHLAHQPGPGTCSDLCFGLTATVCVAMTTLCWQEYSFIGSYLQGMFDELLASSTNLRGQYSFQKGLGCYKSFHEANLLMLQITHNEMLPKEVHLDPWKQRENSRTCQGSFLSPIRQCLPANDGSDIQTVYFQIVCPKDVDFDTVIRESKFPFPLHSNNITSLHLLFCMVCANQIDRSLSTSPRLETKDSNTADTSSLSHWLKNMESLRSCLCYLFMVYDALLNN